MLNAPHPLLFVLLVALVEPIRSHRNRAKRLDSVGSSFHARRRVQCGVQALQIVDRHLRVDLGRVEALVVQEHLQVADVHARLQQQCRRRMSEEMARTHLAKVCSTHVTAHELAHASRRELLAEIRQK